MTKFLASIPPGVWAVIGTIIAGVILDLSKKWLNKHQIDRDDRKEAREAYKELQDRLDKVEEEVTAWRTKYYDAEVEIARLKRALILAGIDVPDVKP